jgi:hypothetical protein
MRAVLVRYLIVIFTLMSIGGPIHAFAHEADGVAASHFADHGKAPSSHHHHHDGGRACCCDCLGCVPAVAFGHNPADMIRPARYGLRIQYAPNDVWLSGRVPLPDPKPPRLSALI